MEQDIKQKNTVDVVRLARWLEPLGQFLVLLSVGFQLFYIEPANNKLINAQDRLNSLRFSNIHHILERMERNEKPSSPNDDDEIRNDAADDLTRAADYRKSLFPYFFIVFLLGSIMTIIGKSSSIASSKK